MTRRKGRPRGLTPDGPKIRSLREERGLTVRQLAEQIHLHPDSLKQNEQGRPMSKVIANRIATALGVEVGEIASPPEPEPKVTAALDAKTGPVAANDRARSGKRRFTQ
jgi:transcriptional regulator with XRE-family HTH domain